LVSGRTSSRATDWLMRDRSRSLILTEAFTLTLFAGDWAVLPCALGCCAVVPELAAPPWVCWAWPVFAGAGLADCWDGAVLEGAVWACAGLVEPVGVCVVEFAPGLVVPADWLAEAGAPVAVEFCVEVACGAVV
jgi:hypothetical protein